MAHKTQHLFLSPVSPIEPADQHAAGETHASPILETAISQLPGQAARLQLRHGCQLGHIVAFDVKRCRDGGGEEEVRMVNRGKTWQSAAGTDHTSNWTRSVCCVCGTNVMLLHVLYSATPKSWKQIMFDLLGFLCNPSSLDSSDVLWPCCCYILQPQWILIFSFVPFIYFLGQFCFALFVSLLCCCCPSVMCD